MEPPKVPMLVNVAAALFLFNAFTFGLAGVGNLFWGREWAVALSPLELACCVALIVGALHFRRGNRAWWRLLFVLALLVQAQVAAETWVADHKITPFPAVWVVLEWTLLLWPITRHYLDDVDAWRRGEAEHAEAGHFADAEPEQQSPAPPA